MILHQKRVAMDAEREALTAHSHGIIYVVGLDNYIKNGFTAHDASYRIRNLQTAIPVGLQIFAALPGMVKLERELRARFAAYRLEGEWFLRSGDLDQWIAEGRPVDAP